MKLRPKKKINFGSKVVGEGEKIPFIAELGVNHLGNQNNAIKLIDAAIEAGSDFLKFQTYEAKKRYDKKNPKYEEFTKLVSEWQLSKIEEKEVWQHAKSKGAEIFTSVYDVDSVSFAEELGTIGYKIAAFEMQNMPLLKEVVITNKPLIISCGMTNYAEIQKLVEFLDKKNSNYILLHTVSSYPLEEPYSNLKKIRNLIELFDCPVGHSDHTPGTFIPTIAAACGAQIIEKHFTIDPKNRLSDNFFSVTKDQVKEIKFNLEKVYNIIYSPNFEKNDPEKYMKDFKKIIS
jgi:sialic acid synthase SpsE